MARRRAPNRKKSVPLIFKRHGETIRHVDIPADLVVAEVLRLQSVIHRALGLLDRIPRLRHPILKMARFKFTKAIESFVTAMTPEQARTEIGRLNFVLSDAAAVLERMRSSFTALNEARFAIRYGQTARKREAGWNSFKKDRVDTESIPDPEGASAYDDM